jgi:putative aminopeptidase FrvX
MPVDQLTEWIKEFCEASGPSGFEGPVRRLFEERMRPFADRFLADGIGSSVAVREGAPSPRVLLAGHLDEIGFLVTQVTDQGFLRFQTLGGWWEQVMLAQRVVVETRQGPVPGVIGSKPPHLMDAEARKKMTEKKDMYIDVGASSAAEALAFGVRPGDPVVPYGPFQTLKNPELMAAKAWDDRFGVVAMLEVFRRLSGERLPNTVFAAATVQEEVGLRGATTVGNLVGADVAIVLDVGIAGDTPGVEPWEARAKLGGGPTLLLYDATLIPHRGLRDFVVETAEREGIPLQFDAMAMGGTDGGALHKAGAGVPTVVLGVPTRYIHSHVAVFHRRDLEATASLLVAVVRGLDEARLGEIRATAGGSS